MKNNYSKQVDIMKERKIISQNEREKNQETENRYIMRKLDK